MPEHSSYWPTLFLGQSPQKQERGHSAAEPQPKRAERLECERIPPLPFPRQVDQAPPRHSSKSDGIRTHSKRFAQCGAPHHSQRSNPFCAQFLTSGCRLWITDAKLLVENSFSLTVSQIK